MQLLFHCSWDSAVNINLYHIHDVCETNIYPFVIT